LVGYSHVFNRLVLQLGVHGRLNISQLKILGYLTPRDEFAVGWVSSAAWTTAGARLIHDSEQTSANE
jgi:hypothetical protein